MGTALPPNKPKVNVPALEKLMSNNNLDQAAAQFEADMAKLIRPIQTNTPRLTDAPGSRERKEPIHRDGSGKPQPVDIATLLAERDKTHGDYSEHATITQRIKRAFGDSHHINKLNDMQVESLEMIAHKIGRILAGDPDFRDHWDDIAGYAKLVADRCSK